MRLGRLIAMIIIVLWGFSEASADSRRDASRIKREKQEASRHIKETSLKLTENEQRLQRELNQLNLVEAELSRFNNTIKRQQLSLDSLDAKMRSLNDSIAMIDKNLQSMRDKYATAIRKMRSSRGDMNTLSFIFSAESFTQAYRRMRYLQQFSQWRDKKSAEIKSIQTQLAERNQALNVMQLSKRKTLNDLQNSRDSLVNLSREAETIVAGLQKEGRALKSLIDKKEKEAEALDRELERLIEQQRIAEERRLAEEKRKREEEERRRIAEEQRRKRQADSLEQLRLKQEAEKREREQSQKEKQEQERLKKQREEATKAEQEKAQPDKSPKQSITPPKKETAPQSKPMTDKELTSAFAAMRGRLPMPVASRYSVVREFGVHPHPKLKHIKVRNSGIDLEVPANTPVCTVFDGVVSAIFQQPGYNNIVMVRHGSYITIYTNLVNITVKKGDMVKARRNIGEVFADADDNNRSVLHFEIRRETEKLNPAEWLGVKR